MSYLLSNTLLLTSDENYMAERKRKAPPSAFKKGYDPRRYVFSQGVTPFREQLSDALNKESMSAVNLIVNTVNDETASLKLRLIAGKELLDRCLGTSVNQVVVQTLDSSNAKDVSSLSTKDLEKLVTKLTAEENEQGIIEGEFTEEATSSNAPDCETAVKNSLKHSGIK